MIMAILEFRTRVCELYQKLQLIIDPIFKFLLALIVLRSLNTVIGYDARLTRTIILLVLSLISAFTPSSVLVFLCMGLIVANVYSVSVILAVFILIIFMIMYSFFLRFTPQYGYVLVAIPVLYLFRVPYLMPLLLGVMANPLTILPTVCGVFLYYIIYVIQNAATMNLGTTADDVLLLFSTVIDTLLSNKEMLYTMGIFAIVIVIVYVIRKLQFNYSFEISIGVGVVTSIFGFLFRNSVLQVKDDTMSMILFTLLSGFLVVIIYFFRRILDYTAVEHVQFEDDDYYYYVRAVPKIRVGVTERSVKMFNENTRRRSMIQDAEDDAEDEDDDEIFDTRELDRRLLEKRTRETQMRDRYMQGIEDFEEEDNEFTDNDNSNK